MQCPLMRLMKPKAILDVALVSLRSLVFWKIFWEIFEFLDRVSPNILQIVPKKFWMTLPAYHSSPDFFQIWIPDNLAYFHVGIFIFSPCELADSDL